MIDLVKYCDYVMMFGSRNRSSSSTRYWLVTVTIVLVQQYDDCSRFHLDPEQAGIMDERMMPVCFRAVAICAVA